MKAALEISVVSEQRVKRCFRTMLRAHFLFKNSTTFTIIFNNNFMSYSRRVTGIIKTSDIKIMFITKICHKSCLRLHI